MNNQTDQELLRHYIERKSDSAFGALVERYIDLVHSAALRMSGDPHSAKDITQCVFVALSQSARQLTDRSTLAGWLHNTARNLAAKEIRSQIRRRTREQEVAAMKELLATDDAANWEEIAPHLDAAVGELNEPERDAVLLRYFKNYDLRTVGTALGIFAYAGGNVIYSGYLGIPYVAGSGELLVFCAALAGAGLGFLWFNTYPAQVFMGDIGALALGAALGLVAVAVRQELVLFIMGGVFVVESVSVIIQVASYKLTGRRIFRMAPLHHHFELKGWPEPKVIVRFWIITVILVLIGLASLKIR